MHCPKGEIPCFTIILCNNYYHNHGYTVAEPHQDKDIKIRIHKSSEIKTKAKLGSTEKPKNTTLILK